MNGKYKEIWDKSEGTWLENSYIVFRLPPLRSLSDDEKKSFSKLYLRANGISLSSKPEEYADVNFEEDWECDENEFLSFVKGSLKLHKVKAISYDLECFNVTVGNS